MNEHGDSEDEEEDEEPDDIDADPSDDIDADLPNKFSEAMHHGTAVPTSARTHDYITRNILTIFGFGGLRSSPCTESPYLWPIG